MTASNSSVTIRTATESDIESLKTFFIEAYGDDTIFRDEKFLRYYFFKNHKDSQCVVAATDTGEIVSHYGGLPSEICLNGKIISLVWGVNAYTLPEWRGKGLNGKMVDYLLKNNEANSGIGMAIDSTLFYKKLDYNVFNQDTYDRFVYILDEKAYDVVAIIGQDVERAKLLFPVNLPKKNNNFDSIVEITAENFETFTFDITPKNICTTNRNRAFLAWRLFGNPYVTYKVYGYLNSDNITAYLAFREETLMPTGLIVNRIVDLAGTDAGVDVLLQSIVDTSQKDKRIYIDFSAFGKLYENLLQANGFIKLADADVALLPQVSSPIMHRENHEFVAIQSIKYAEAIKKLSKENVYFTRIDADRDRINKLYQIQAIS